MEAGPGEHHSNSITSAVAAGSVCPVSWGVHKAAGDAPHRLQLILFFQLKYEGAAGQLDTCTLSGKLCCNAPCSMHERSVNICSCHVLYVFRAFLTGLGSCGTGHSIHSCTVPLLASKVNKKKLHSMQMPKT